jgi:hypothetical protein
MTFFATQLASDGLSISTTAAAPALLATPKATAATATASGVVVVVSTSTATLGGHVCKGMRGAAMQLHALLKADQLGV